MSAFAIDNVRRLIPRWRFADQGMASAEYAGDPRSRRRVQLSRSYLDQLLADWQENRTLGRAIDLVSCGIGGGWLSEVGPAADYLLAQKKMLSPQVLQATRYVLRCEPHDKRQVLLEHSQIAPNSVTFEAARAKVSTARRRLRFDPRSMLTWLDLARAFAILGQEQKSIWAMERALHLAPHHRHALRAAARLFVHTGKLGRAHALLKQNPRTPSDAWLMAAEISIATIAENKPQFAGRARKLVDSGQLPPAHLTELQSALGTLEYYHGANRRARRDFRASLEAPTDNSVAQARWISTRLSGIAISDSAFQLPQSFEARCWRALEDERWEQAQAECFYWLCDESFSSRPAQLGSYIGVSLTSDPGFAITCGKAGLQAEPRNAMLHNNIAVAFAYQNDLTNAFNHFGKIETPLPQDFPAHVYWATAGLLCFRAGDIDQGRKFYGESEAIAPAEEKVRVAIFQAREELNSRTEKCNEAVARARDFAKGIENKHTNRMLALLESQLSARSYIGKQLYDDRNRSAAYHNLVPLLSGTVWKSSGSGETVSSGVDYRSSVMRGKKSSHTGHRSSVTGQFVKGSYAKRYPNRTQKESIPNPGHGDTGRSKKR